jgi:hypothetical protein
MRLSSSAGSLEHPGKRFSLATIAAALASAVLALAAVGLSNRGAPESPTQLLASSPGLPDETKQRVADAYAKAPLAFVPNRGQTDRHVRYYVQGPEYAFYFTSDKAVISFNKGKRDLALHLTPLGANPNAKLEASDRDAGKVNYLIGSERHTNLPTYHELVYRQLWPGIDMVFRGQGGTLKYEFHIAPGADPADIRLAYRGADDVALGSAGNLLVQTPLGTMRDSRPRSYQRRDGKRVAVGSRYLLDGGSGAYGFALGPSYDRRRPLVIDPGLVYSSYLGGGSLENTSHAIAVDAAGNAYVAGTTRSTDFPTTAGVLDTTLDGTHDIAVTKLNPSGSGQVYSTYLGGPSADTGAEVEVDTAGNAYVMGGSAGPSYPTTAGAFDTSHNGLNDVVVSKLNPTGSALVYSTYLGGAANEQDADLAIDAAGNAYVAGITQSTMFTPYPTTAGAFDITYNGGTYDAFVTKLNAAGSALAYSTYLGGSGNEGFAGATIDAPTSDVDVDSAGNAYVTGETASSNFPVTAGAWDTSYNGPVAANSGGDAYVTKLNATGSALDYSTFLGAAARDRGTAIAVDSAGSAYVAGNTESSGFPFTAGAYDTTYNAVVDGFVTKLSANGSALAYSTFLGGAGNDQPHAVDTDSSGNAYVTGTTASSNFPATTNSVDTSYNGSDAFVTKINAAGSGAPYSTFLGGAGLDIGTGIAFGLGSAYVVGYTASTDFPTTAGAFDTSYNGGPVGDSATRGDLFVTALDPLVGPPYPRPGGGSPYHVPLVPAYALCTSPNSQHVTPLDEPSCTPPVRESSQLTIGTVGNGSASARFTTIIGNPATLPDEADVAIQFAASDVRNVSNGLDYTGQVVLSPRMRVTDSSSGSSGEAQGTVQDTSFGIPVSCSDNGGAGGGTCSFSGSVDALVPGFIRETKRTVIAALSVDVLDAGPDGDVDPVSDPPCPFVCGSGDEGVFLRQGVFAP